MTSVISVFIVIANDGWSTIYFNHARMPEINNVVAVFYFVSLIIFG